MCSCTGGLSLGAEAPPGGQCSAWCSPCGQQGLSWNAACSGWCLLNGDHTESKTYSCLFWGYSDSKESAGAKTDLVVGQGDIRRWEKYVK